MSEQLHCTITPHTAGYQVMVAGEVDLATAARLAEVLVQLPDGDVVADLSGVTFLDSSGLKALVAAHHHITRRDRELRIVGARPGVLRVLEISGIDQVLEIERDPSRLD